MLIHIQAIVRQTWLAMVVGDDTSGPLPHYSGLNSQPRIRENGEKLLTPNWKTRTNETNTRLIEQVVQKIKFLSVSVFPFFWSCFSWWQYTQNPVLTRVTDDAIVVATETYFDQMRRKYRAENGIVRRKSDKENPKKLFFSHKHTDKN